MRVSVVVCTYDGARYDVFSDCVESVLAQSHSPIELVIVVDGDDALADRIREDFAHAGEHVDDVLIHTNDRNRGISWSRTKGADLASGEVVAFIDDDGIARPDWIAEHVVVYEQHDALAVGGVVEPEWVTDRPSFFPEEFYWLVGCTEPGFADHLEEIRNGYGSNVSYDREAFLEIGGYDQHTGRKGESHIQAHEAPAGIRLQKRFGEGVLYTEKAVVDHQLFDYRGRFRWLVFRSFWQGVSKRLMGVLYPDSGGNERAFLWTLFGRRVPGRLKKLVRSPSVAQVEQLAALFVFTFAVGLGYLYGMTKRESGLLRG